MRGSGKNLIRLFQRSDSPSWVRTDLIREELFSAGRLEQHAESLAAAQAISSQPERGLPLVRRVRDNEQALLHAYRSIAAAVAQKKVITPAAEWLIDNFHIAEEQIRNIRTDLPVSYYRQLPKLSEGPFQGYPRIFEIAWAFVAHTDSRFETETLRRFVAAYQRIQPLTIGELWALAITVRVVLIENLRRLADLILGSQASRDAADVFADLLLEDANASPPEGSPATTGAHGASLQRSFAMQLVQRLRGEDPATSSTLVWLHEQLESQGTTADEIVNEELKSQSAANVTIRNIFTSMRLISETDWADFFESVDLVDAVFREGSEFEKMDFPTRDRYRRAVERLSRRSVHSEIKIAKAAVLTAARALPASKVSDEISEHNDPGYYLIGEGRPAFEKRLGFRPPFKEWLVRLNAVVGPAGYLALTGGVAALLLFTAILLAETTAPFWTTLPLLISGTFVATDIALSFVNRLVTDEFGAAVLPGLELKDGVPDGCRTLVVIPALLTDPTETEQLLERLEIHYLANTDPNIRFVLLTDWTDALTETTEEDELILQTAVAGIERLNEKYKSNSGQTFFLLHRKRVWSETQQKWIGWERKRGKLHELNRLLRGHCDTTFVTISGEPLSYPENVRYVITLDSDTRLPLGAAKRLIGKMAHALNRPQLDLKIGRVVKGYGVLQPRVTPSLPDARTGTLYQRIFSTQTGIDPYTTAVSDVYQDLFQEGSYSGKGIYDVDAFEQALNGRLPQNAILSHDLLEGIFARAGLVSDVEVFEDFPSRYDVSVSRQHRWTRGDWQLLPWVVGAPAPAGIDRKNIPLLGRWKLIDNLRRSLSAPAAFLSLVSCWALLPVEQALVWTGFTLFAFFLNAFVGLVPRILPGRSGITTESHLRAFRSDLGIAAGQFFLNIAFLPHQAWLMGDAIVRTLWRLVYRRNLLEWKTAAAANSKRQLDIAGFTWQMSGAIGLAIFSAAVTAFINPGTMLLATPPILIWIFSPLVAWRVSRAPRPVQNKISSEQSANLRLEARRTWHFFETTVTAKSNHLPPDNLQEDPALVIAERTSPTNLGLYLLSILTARDLGWLGTVAAIDRLENTLETMGRLERFRGHFFNWYDTNDLRPLEPRYISTVDSGNLAGHLLVLREAFREMLQAPIFCSVAFDGIADTNKLAQGALKLAEADNAPDTTDKQIQVALIAVETSIQIAKDEPKKFVRNLKSLAPQYRLLSDLLAAKKNIDSISSRQTELRDYLEALGYTIEGHLRDMEELAPSMQVTSDTGFDIAELSLVEIPARCQLLIERFTERTQPPNHQADVAQASQRDIQHLQAVANRARVLRARIERMDTAARTLFEEMQFGFLLDPTRQLLTIGYQYSENKLDPSCYDLLASEARLASFIAVAKGDVEPKHWFRLGRSLTPIGKGAALISWSGSMFEYLMPELVMRDPQGGLLHATARLIVDRQIEYGRQRGVPWGVSESAYNYRDFEFTYQYSNFGVPGLGFKRGLSENVVIAPYATALAAMIDPGAAIRNFAALADAGALGSRGWYEAIDYTPSRVSEGKQCEVVRAYMAHHQGMSLVAIANTLLDGIIQNRFHADPLVQAAEMLLQERPPRDVSVKWVRAEELDQVVNIRQLVPPMLRRFKSPHDRIPRTHLLSNGQYAVMVNAAGAGFTRWRNLAVIRWREDVTRDPWGSFVYLRDVHNGQVWSAGFHPSGVPADNYDVTFSEDRAEIKRRDGSLSTTLDVLVSPEADGDVRRVSITNRGLRSREIELTSYAELVLAPAADDTSHPAFSKLFVQTEFVPKLGALLATRRRRTPQQSEIWAAHLSSVDSETTDAIQFETDRARFLGRGNDPRSPVAVLNDAALSGTTGTVLDPIFSIRRRVRIRPGSTVRVSFWTLVANSRAAILDLADKHNTATAFDRAATLARTQAQVQLHYLGVSTDEAHLFQRLANRVLYSDPSLRPPSDVLLKNNLGPSALWAHGISGDLPIVLCRIDAAEDLDTVRQLVRAHHYWRTKQLAVDLVVINERSTSYIQDLQSDLEAIVRVNASRALSHTAAPGSVFLLRADLVSSDFRNVLQAVSRVVIVSRRGSLSEQVKRLPEGLEDAPPDMPVRRVGPAEFRDPPPLKFFNGIGGFSEDGREYVSVLDGDQVTPAPWLNVISNEHFGFQVSAEGSGYSWSVNSRENQLTPRSNDPVSDTTTEALYVSDLDSGDVWTATPLPVRTDASRYIARHGQGYSRFQNTSYGVSLDLLQFVALSDPVKISRLKIKNNSGRRRRLAITGYAEWTLGTDRANSAAHISTEIDPATGAMFARNPWRQEFGNRIAFADLLGAQQSLSGDRTEFVGRNGSLAGPAALARRTALSNRVGAGFDPCAALQTVIELPVGAEADIVFLLGETSNRDEATTLVQRYRQCNLDEVLDEVTRHWDELLSKVQVETPDKAMNILVNRWLLYQTIVCRIWARSGFYQASGAYGFRDQLQDGMALSFVRPAITREHLLRAASRQFVEGDFQHWWLPSSGKGIRTNVSDDCLWLAFCVAQYIKVSGDVEVLDEKMSFLDGRQLAPHEHDAFFEPDITAEKDTLFEHCARGIDRALKPGRHGLPLMGGGDWNDGMNLVGAEGQGESVWLGWFLHATIEHFVSYAEQRGDTNRVALWRDRAAGVRKAIDEHAWDGVWYRRGYFDDGSPLGSATSEECRIDSIAQSWGVLSGAADPSKAARAMTAVRENLIDPQNKLALLFTPPFDKTPLEPGYIKGYPPGIRENGGQYTHAAVWFVQALAKFGNGDGAAEVFSMLNPINHALTFADAQRYKVEPYAVCADVYSVGPHVGRGGWTWYTGSAAWMYRAALESILGFQIEGDVLKIDPCIPRSWHNFEISFRYERSHYRVLVENIAGLSRGVKSMELDGSTPVEGNTFKLVDDGGDHVVRVFLGE